MNFNVRQKKVINATEPNIICLAGAGCGKCIPNSTNIPTPDGWRKVEEIKIGDYLFDRQGNPTKVLGVYPQGKKEVYEITFGDGRQAKCSIDHIWSVHKRTWGEANYYRERTTEEILKDNYKIVDKRGRKQHSYSIPCCQPVQYSEKTYLIHPYVIGAFLGDGCCKGHSRLVLSSENDEIPEYCAELIGNIEIKDWYGQKYKHTFFNKTTQEYLLTKDFFKDFSEELLQYSYDKKIPSIYKYGSIEQRYQLLQGLFDTDGSIQKNNGSVSFTSTSLSLIKDVQEVLYSLGHSSIITETKRKSLYTNTCYTLRVNMSHKDKINLFKLKRKRKIAESFKDKKQRHDYTKTTIVNIKKLDYSEDMTCFYVDNREHLFLMNDFIVTHNTSVLTERISHLITENNVDPKKIVAISFTTMAAEEMKKRLGDIAEGAFIGTIHSYANSICIANGISTEKYLADAEFDKIIEKVLTIPIKRYFPVTHLLVDEFQDTGSLEYRFIERIPAKNRFYIGDERQAIYGFKGCSDEFLRMCHSDISFTTYYLNQNYRCAPNILSFADSYLNTMDKISLKSEAVKTKDGIVEEDSTLLDAIEELEWTGDYQNWAIICRTNNELAAAVDFLDKRKIPNLSFKKGDLDLVEMEGLLRENKVKVLTIHTAKGLEFKKVIVIGAKTFNEEERKISYVAATRAEQALYCCPSICKRGKKGRPQNRDVAEAGKIIQQMAKNNIVF
jgi:hypothetical protein